jgi:hypothetical protein
VAGAAEPIGGTVADVVVKEIEVKVIAALEDGYPE